MKTHSIIMFQKHLRHFLAAIVLILLSIKTDAQTTAASYSFSASTGTYTPITGGTVLSSGAGMDDVSFLVTIPSFTYLGTAYTQVAVSENGFVQFGSTLPTTGVRSYLSSGDATARTGVSAYSRDLGGKSATSNLRTETIGSEIIFQWTNMANFFSTTQTYTFQIRLNTSTNVISVVYNTMTSTSSTNAQVGLRGSLTDFNNRTSTTSWAASAAGVFNFSLMSVSPTVTPVSGQTYTWTPPPPCSAKPAGGTIVSSAGTAAICPSSVANLSVTGSTIASALTYVWDSSLVSATGPWSPIAAATAPTYIASPPGCSNVFYRRRTICSAVALFDSSTATSVSVRCAVTTPYFENFETLTANTTGSVTWPNCMTHVGTRGGTGITVQDRNRFNHTPGGSKYAYFQWSCNDFMFTPGIIVTAGKTYQFSYWYINDGTPFDSLTMYYGNAPNSTSMTSRLGQIVRPSNTTYRQYKVQFVATTSGVQYFGIKCNANAVPWYQVIDDVSLQEVPPCAGKPITGAPSSSASRLCGLGNVTLDLPGIVPALGLSYQWQDSSASGTWSSDPGRPSFGGNTLSFTTSDFDKNTYFRCIVRCTLTGDSTISPSILINAGAYNLPYSENFEGITRNNELPICMSATNLGTFVQSFTTNSTLGRRNNTPGGSKYAFFRWGCNDYIFSPPINFVGGHQYILSFWYTNDGGVGWNTLRAHIGDAPTAAAMSKSLKTISNPRNTTYVEYRDTFTIAITGVYHFGIFCNATFAPWHMSIDDINLQFKPCSGSPAAGIIAGSSPSGTGICPNTIITLKSVGATPTYIPGIRYQWQRSLIGSSPIVWSNIAGATDSVYTSDTLAGYDYRLAVICTPKNDSSFTVPYSLPRLPIHPPISISPSISPITYCLGDTVKFIATNFPGAIYDWMKDSVVIPGWKFSDLGATEPGTYMVKVSSSAAPCPAYSNSVRLNVNDPGYTVALITPIDSIVCDGATVTLSGTASKAGVSYQWRKNNVVITGAISNTYVASTSGFYTLTAWDGISSCPALSRAIRIIVNPNPPAIIHIPGGTTTACEDVGVQLNANPVPSFSYQWLRGGSTVIGFVDSILVVRNPGSYVVKVRSSDGCVSLSSPVVVNILPSPTPIINKSGFVLSGSSAYIGYQWIRNGSIMPGRTKDTLNLSANGTYRLRVTDVNGCVGVSNPILVDDQSLSIAGNFVSDEIKIYPNPSEGKVFIESPVGLHIEVKDLTGKTILQTQDAKEVDLSKYANGIYLFILRDQGQQMIQQLRVTKMSR